jgi:hypothetical protein
MTPVVVQRRQRFRAVTSSVGTLPALLLTSPARRLLCCAWADLRQMQGRRRSARTNAHHLRRRRHHRGYHRRGVTSRLPETQVMFCPPRPRHDSVAVVLALVVAADLTMGAAVPSEAVPEAECRGSAHTTWQRRPWRRRRRARAEARVSTGHRRRQAAAASGASKEVMLRPTRRHVGR